MRSRCHLLDYWRDHPGDKAMLAAFSEQLLWQPNVIDTGSDNGSGIGRRVLEPAYMIVPYALAEIGLVLVPRPYAVLAVLLAAYQSLCAAVFVGATRYRVAWDFVLAVLAAAALDAGARRLRR